MMRRIFLASPYAGNIPLNTAYARACLYDSITRGEAPFAPHLLYPQVLDESSDRKRGMILGYAWMRQAHEVVFYTDLGMTSGMDDEYAFAKNHGLVCSLRGLTYVALQELKAAFALTFDTATKEPANGLSS